MGEFMLAAANTSPLAQAIREAIGATADEDVQITTPEFNRPASWEPAMLPPDTTEGWRAILGLSRDQLRDLGCRAFGCFTTTPPKDGIAHKDAWFFAHEDTATATHELWLFPAEWYASIPPGFPLACIDGCIEPFMPGTTDDDRRFGMLAYGLMLEKPRGPRAPEDQ